MYSAVFVLACVTCASAFPVLFLTYSESGRSKPQHHPSKLDCSFPLPYYRAGGAISYRCKPVTKAIRRFNPAKPIRRPSFEIIETIVPETNLEVLEAIEVDSYPSPHQATALEEPRYAKLAKTGGIIVNDAATLPEEPEIDPSFDVFVPVDNRIPEKHKCGDHEVYVAELDICEDMKDHHVAPGSVAPVEDTRPIDTPIVVSVGYEEIKCEKDQLFLPEIGICVPINNCWPHESCDDQPIRD